MFQPSAIIDNGAKIGRGAMVWHFCHIMGKAEIGEDCTLGQNVFVGDNVIIGNNVKIQNNVSIYDGVVIEDNVFLGPSCVFTNIKNPRAEVSRRGCYEKTIVHRGATIGANATIVCGVEIGEYSFIGAGAVVTKDVPAHALMAGIPAKQVGQVDRDGNITRTKILFLSVGCINYDCNINFYEPLKQIFSNVINYNYIQRMKQIGKESMNAEIIKVVRKERPDYVLLHTYQEQVDLGTLDAINALGIKIIAWFSDDQWRFENYSKIIAKHVFCSVTTDKNSVEKYMRSGLNVIKSQWASNKDYYQKTDSEFVYDVSFVGQNYGKRLENLLYLKGKGVPVVVFGRGFGRYLEFDEIIRIFNTSKINLSFSGSSRSDDIKQIKGRIFEVPMCGGFLLTEYVDGIEEYYEIGKEIECFESMAEAVEKISYYLRHNDKRIEIANNGYQRSLGEHTWIKRLTGIFDEVKQKVHNAKSD